MLHTATARPSGATPIAPAAEAPAGYTAAVGAETVCAPPKVAPAFPRIAARRTRGPPLGPSSNSATAAPPLPTPIAGAEARTPVDESVCSASNAPAAAGSRAAATLTGVVVACHTTVALPAPSMPTCGIRPGPSGSAGPNVPPGRRRAASTTSTPPDSRAQAATAVPSGATATATAGSSAPSADSGNGGSHDGAAAAGAADSRAPTQ